MDLKKHHPLKDLLFLSVLSYSIHKLFFFLNQDNFSFQNFHFPIEYTYGFFFICSLLIILTLNKIYSINIDYVGYTFLLLTFIKILLSLIVLLPILNSEILNIKTEKINFFVIFALFLAIETVVVVKILNKKQ